MKTVQVWTNPVKKTPHGFLYVFLCDSVLDDAEIITSVKKHLSRYGYTIREMKIEQDMQLIEVKCVRLRNEIIL